MCWLVIFKRNCFFQDLVSLLRNAYILLQSLKIFYQYKQYQQSALI